MTKTANSGASEANANDLSDSTEDTQETPKESASGHSCQESSVERREVWPTSDWLRELYVDDRCNTGTPLKQVEAEFDAYERRLRSIAYDIGYTDGIKWATGKADHEYQNPYKTQEES